MPTKIPYKFYKYQVNGVIYYGVLPSYNKPAGYTEATPQEVQAEIQKYQSKSDSWSRDYLNALQTGLNNVQSGSSPYIVDDQGRFAERLLLAPGYNIITAKAVDRFGKEKEYGLELVYKKPPDEIATSSTPVTE